MYNGNKTAKDIKDVQIVRRDEIYQEPQQFNRVKKKHCQRSILWVWEIIVDFLVEYIEDDI
jgi:hypothetical protein